MAGAQLAPHLPADPEQQDAAGEQQADDLQKLGGEPGEDDAQDRGGDDAEQDGLVALFLGEAGRGEADDDGVVAGERRGRSPTTIRKATTSGPKNCERSNMRCLI